MNVEEIKKKLRKMKFGDTIVLENPDFADAVIGVSFEGNLIYDYDRMVSCLKSGDGMEDLEAMEFIEHNTFRSVPYMRSAGVTPVFVQTIYPTEEDE